jgi:hypothetical protein
MPSIDVCMRSDGREAGRQSWETLARWYAVMVPTPPAPPGYMDVPDALLPAGVSTGWFNAAQYARNLAVDPPPVPGSYLALRDMMRAHRVQMRIARNIIDANRHTDEFLRRVELNTGVGSYWLGSTPHMAELDRAPDPDVAMREEIRTLRAEAADRSAFIAATRTLVASTPDGGGGSVAVVKRARAKANAKAK